MNKQQTTTPLIERRWILDVAIFSLIVVLGIASRFGLVDLPNFKPVAALILFGGFFFRRAWPAIAALVLIMVVSDWKLGVYNWQLAICVYGSLALACGMGVWVKRSLNPNGSNGIAKIGWKQTTRFVIASLTMSTAFYLLTNGAVWWMGQWYPETWSGLVNCYAAGLPFYRATLLGDLFFTGVFVGAYCGVQALVPRLSQSPVESGDEQMLAGSPSISAC